MEKPLLALARRHLLLESKFIVLAISAVLFLGLPYYQICQILYGDFINYRQLKSLSTDFTTATGTLNKIYQVNSVLPYRSSLYVFEFSYLGKHVLTRTLERQQLASNKVGDQVLVFYNQQAAMIEHIPPFIASPTELLTVGLATSAVLMLPLLLATILMLRSLRRVVRVYRLHAHGCKMLAEITYFKVLRHNNYLVEYLYQSKDNTPKLRQRTIASNYAQIGEKKTGDQLEILYDQNDRTITCVNENNYE